MAVLLACALGPLLLLPTPFRGLAVAWAWAVAIAGWSLLMLGLIQTLAGDPEPMGLPERLFRRWVARFAPDPEGLWLRWARQAHRPALAGWCLARAVDRGGAEALFQEGLAYLEGGLGPGGVIAGVARLRQAAQAGHAEAAFRLAEALRTGHGCEGDPAAALAWYRRSASAGFGRAAAWLAHAFACGDGVAADAEEARRWADAAGRLAPHPPLKHSPLRHDAAPMDPLVRVRAAAMERLEAGLDRLVARPAGRWALLLGAGLLALLGLGIVGAFFWAGSSGLYHLPLLLLAPPAGLLGWQALRLRREGPRRGRDRLREDAEGGDPEACFRLGLAHRKGTPEHPRDDLTAALWFRKAADAGHREAMRALAEAYRGGHGVPRDPRRAAQWEASAGGGET